MYLVKFGMQIVNIMIEIIHLTNGINKFGLSILDLRIRIILLFGNNIFRQSCDILEANKEGSFNLPFNNMDNKQIMKQRLLDQEFSIEFKE